MEEELLQTISSFKEWKPTDRQADFLSVPYDVFEALYGGALGGGKTDALIILPIVSVTNEKLNDGKYRMLYEHPDFVGVIFRRTYTQLEHKVIPRAKQVYSALGAVYNETKKVFTFPSGARMHLGHMEQDGDVSKYDTNEYHYVGIDQAEQFSEYQLRYIPSRIRRTTKALPVIIRMAANPGGISHTYLRDRFVKPCPNGNMILFDKVTGMKRIYIPAKLEDNPHIMNEDPDYINRLSLLPEQEREAKRSGDWFSFAGQRFSEFRSKRFPNEPINALHVIAPFKIPQFWPKILSIDWGWSAKTFAIWYAINPIDERIIIYRCFGVKKTTIRSWASTVAQLSQNDGTINIVVLDSSCFNENGLGITQAQEFQNASGFRPVKADKDRHSGVSLIHELLRWSIKPPKFIPPEGFDREIADRILRIRGLQAYNEYVNLFIPEKPETNIPRLQILYDEHDRSYKDTRELIDAIQNCQFDEKDKEDYAEFDGDDPVDSLRYGLKMSNVYIENAKKTNTLLNKEAEIVNDLEQNQDMTAFYMRMAYLDQERKKIIARPIRRYH